MDRYLEQGARLNVFSSVIANRALLVSFIARDLKGRYVGSAMGVYWNIINPLVLVAVYTFVFAYVMKAKVPPGNGTDNFAVYIFCGLLPWIAFQEATLRNSTVIIDNANLVKKVNFPTEILVIYVTLASFIHELIALGLLFLLLLLLGAFPGGNALFLVAVFMGQLLLTLGFSFLFSSLTVYIRDVAHLLNSAMLVLFFATPIMYPLAIVPEGARALMGLNPVTQLVEMYRALILGDRLHSFRGTAYFFGVAVAVFILGSYVFGKTKGEFADLI